MSYNTSEWDDFTLLNVFLNKTTKNTSFVLCPFFTQLFSPRHKGNEVCLLFPSMELAPDTPHPLPTLQSHQTAFFRVLSPPELQSFHWPAHTRTQLYCAPAMPVIQRLLLMARQRLLSPENAAAMRTISPEHTEEFGHTWEVSLTPMLCETGTAEKIPGV